MYADPTHVRDHEVKVRLNDDELALVDALARYNRRQRAAFMRELVMASVRRYEQKASDKDKVA
ncbi:MAG TPA: ribbon-helix-helix protein, CopG family [Mizugakiibacter sp.]